MELFFKLICFGLMTGSCMGLTCYNCRYQPNVGGTSCKYVDSTTPTRKCSNDAVACAKVVYKSETIERFCASLCSSGTTSSGDNVYCCKSNLCNNKDPLLVSNTTFLLLVLAGLLFRP